MTAPRTYEFTEAGTAAFTEGSTAATFTEQSYRFTEESGDHDVEDLVPGGPPPDIGATSLWWPDDPAATVELGQDVATWPDYIGAHPLVDFAGSLGEGYVTPTLGVLPNNRGVFSFSAVKSVAITTPGPWVSNGDPMDTFVIVAIPSVAGADMEGTTPTYVVITSNEVGPNTGPHLFVNTTPAADDFTADGLNGQWQMWDELTKVETTAALSPSFTGEGLEVLTYRFSLVVCHEDGADSWIEVDGVRESASLVVATNIRAMFLVSPAPGMFLGAAGFKLGGGGFTDQNCADLLAWKQANYPNLEA